MQAQKEAPAAIDEASPTYFTILHPIAFPFKDDSFSMMQ
jgi:hypothetical protein